ncbi:hypothetical protein NDU88_003001 [Pleurodeles waltl]|uniref:Uncharacterized protein n=1 Tax=Pleurodeles waltl TaxID=8319 RepID=A0AAV7MQE3_PLEWA|nr:hypothetical protein NDU88_003001 [Pleurodeles waltl]
MEISDRWGSWHSSLSSRKAVATLNSVAAQTHAVGAGAAQPSAVRYPAASTPPLDSSAAAGALLPFAGVSRWAQGPRSDEPRLHLTAQQVGPERPAALRYAYATPGPQLVPPPDSGWWHRIFPKNGAGSVRMCKD